LADFGLLLDFGRVEEEVDMLLLELFNVFSSPWSRMLSLKFTRVAIGMFSERGSSPKIA